MPIFFCVMYLDPHTAQTPLVQMQKLREAMASSSAAASSIFKAPAGIDDGSRTSALQSWSNLRRRVEQATLERLGKAEAGDDSEYEARKARVLEYQKLLNDTRLAAGAWLDSARAQAHNGGERLAVAIRAIYGSGRPGDGQGMSTPARAAADAAAGVAEQLAVLDGEGRSAFDNAFIRDVILPLDTLVAQAKAISGQCRERELLRLDFDARRRTVDGMKAGPSTAGSSGGARSLFGGSKPSDPAKVLHKEEKLERTKQALDQSTAGLYEQFDLLERTRYGSGGAGMGVAAPESLPAILQTWVKMQHAWAVANNEQLANLAAIPNGQMLPGIDPPAVYGPSGVCYGTLSGGAAGHVGPTTTQGYYQGQPQQARAQMAAMPPGGQYMPSGVTTSRPGGMASAMGQPVGSATAGVPPSPDPQAVPWDPVTEAAFQGGPTQGQGYGGGMYGGGGGQPGAQRGLPQRPFTTGTGSPPKGGQTYTNLT